MTMSLPEAVLYAYRSSAARITLSPDEARSYGRRLEYSSPDEIRAYHYGLMKRRDAIVLPHVQRALDEVERGALAKELGLLLHAGLVWGDLAYYCAPAQYWPEDEDVPIDVERQLWSATLYWTHVLEQDDEVTMAEWTLCVTAGVACESEIQRRLDQHPVSKDVLDIVSQDDDKALKRMLGRPKSRFRNIEEYSQVSVGEVRSIHNARLGELIDKKVVRHWMWATIQASEGQFDGFPLFLHRAYLDEVKKPKAKKRGARDSEGQRLALAQVELDLDNPDVTDALKRQRAVADGQLPSVDEAELREFEETIGKPARFVRFLLDNPEESGLPNKEIAERLGVTPRTILNWKKKLQNELDVRSFRSRFFLPPLD